MTEEQFRILSAAQDFVSELFSSKVDKDIHFHTLQHTLEVLAGCETMADYYHLEDEDRFALMLAAWFHDTGYSGGQAMGHENVSVELATRFLNEHKVNQNVINKVVGCINATRLPQNPTSLIEQIICDADLFHLGTSDFKEKNKLLRAELNDFGKLELSKKDWRKKNIEFLSKHKYFTSYAKEHLDPLKQVYLQELNKKAGIEDKVDKKQAKDNKEPKPALVAKSEKPKDKGLSADEQKKVDDIKKKKEKESQSERAISTVFRIVAQSQNNLSQMADTKANILISVNSIILSIVIGTVFRDLTTTDTNLQIPIAILVIVCVTAIVFSILATRPNITSGTFTKEDIADKKTNLLFFGNFHKMGLGDYDWAMTEMLADKNYLYSSMIKDTYFLGIVLAKKYRYLRIAYNIFMFGLILAMVAFTVGVLWPKAGEVYAQ